VRLDHVGLAVRSVEASAKTFAAFSGARVVHREELPRERVRVAFLDAGGVLLELLEPTAEDGPLARFLAARGEGLHHLAFEVPDLARALAEATSAGQRPVDDRPRLGARGRLIAFLHPEASHGVLVELVQRAS